MDLMRDTLAKYRDTLPEDRRVLYDRLHLVDVALKVVGIGSVGTLCIVALFLTVAGNPLFLAAEGGERIGAGTLCRRQRLQPSWPARRNGPAADAIGLGHVPGMGHRTEGPAVLHPPTARRETRRPCGDVRWRVAHAVRRDMRLGAGARPRKGRRTVDDQRLSRQE